MALEDELVGVLKQSEKKSRKLKNIKEKNTNNGIHVECIAKNKKVEDHESFEGGNFTNRRVLTDGVERKKKKKLETPVDNNGCGRMSLDCAGNCVSKVEMQKTKRDVNSSADESPAQCEEIKDDAFVDSEDNAHPTITKMRENANEKEKIIAKLIDECNEDNIEMARMKNKKRKRKKEKKNNDVGAGSVDIETESLGGTEGVAYPSVKKTIDDGTGNENISSEMHSGDELGGFCVSNVLKKGNEEIKEAELIQGKWFSKEEDEIIKEAVHRYIETHDLGDEGLNMVLNSQSFPNVRGCWKEIAAALPERPYTSVYFRGQKLFRKSDIPWTKEDYEFVRKYQEKHGNRWSDMAAELGKFQVHILNAWLRIKLPNRKKGRWSQHEYQTLFDLVNTDLQLKIFEEKKSNCGMLRDNICWMAISEKLGTRNNTTCCMKWYYQLTSPMVVEGKWTDSDDYRLIGALYNLDATSIENVDWDNLLDHRLGKVSLQRWKQMVRHIGNHENKSFAEQVEILAQRYCPYLLEAREAWDSKPSVP
nr:DNA-binding protein REB1-like [Ipomoea batatas]